MTDADRERLKQLALEATPGPWANTDNVKELFGYEPMEWWYVYAKRPENNELSNLNLPVLVCKMAGSRATEQEMEEARYEQFSLKKPCRDPGPAGKDARYIAAWNPRAALDLLQDLEMAELTIADADRELKRLWSFLVEIGKLLGLQGVQIEAGAWATLTSIRNELKQTLRNNEYLGQTAYMMGYQDGKRDGIKAAKHEDRKKDGLSVRALRHVLQEKRRRRSLRGRWKAY